MSKAQGGILLQLQESAENLRDTLDLHKTTNAFPVISAPAAPGDAGDFKGIISRARWVPVWHQRPIGTPGKSNA